MKKLREFWNTLTGKNLPSASSINNDPTHVHKLPSVEDDRARLPIVWFIVIGLVVAGFIANLTVNLFASGGLIVWPFVFAISVLLILNDASSRHGVGVPPFQAYLLFFGILIAFFLFVALVSTINAWLVVALTIGVGFYLAWDWARRKRWQLEIDRRRLAGLCVKCLTPVRSGLDERCPECGLLVNPERLSLFQLGKAISLRAQTSRARQTLTGKGHKPTKGELKIKRMQESRAYSYKKRK